MRESREPILEEIPMQNTKIHRNPWNLQEIIRVSRKVFCKGDLVGTRPARELLGRIYVCTKESRGPVLGYGCSSLGTRWSKILATCGRRGRSPRTKIPGALKKKTGGLREIFRNLPNNEKAAVAAPDSCYLHPSRARNRAPSTVLSKKMEEKMDPAEYFSWYLYFFYLDRGQIMRKFGKYTFTTPVFATLQEGGRGSHLHRTFFT